MVQMDPDGGLIPVYGVGGEMPVEFEVDRTIKKAVIWALFIVLSKMTEHAEIFSGNRAGVQALIKGALECISAKWDADLRERFRQRNERGLGIDVAGTKALCTATVKAQMTQQKKKRGKSWRLVRKRKSLLKVMPLETGLDGLNKWLRIRMVRKRI